MSHLVQAVLTQLRKRTRPERFDLPAAAYPALERALERDLGEPDPWTALHATLRLCAALDGELASPAAAELIREVLRSDRRAVDLIVARGFEVRQVDEARSFARREGRTVAVAAPKHGAAAPARSVPLRDLLPRKRLR